MQQNRALSPEEREQVLARVKPTGAFKPAKQRMPFGVQPVPWEEHLGDLNEWREHKGEGRAILPILSDRAKTASVQNSISNRLRKLYPSESWSTFLDGKFICLRFNGPKRTYSERQQRQDDEQQGSELFAEAV